MIFLDLETRSAADLTRVGGWAYAAHPSTEVLCAVALVDYGDDRPADAYAWTPLPAQPVTGDEWKPRDLSALRIADGAVNWHFLQGFRRKMPPVELGVEWFDPRHRVVAHNAEAFDRPVWLAQGWPEPPGGWLDSLALARRAQLPGKLDSLARELYGIGKEPAESALMRLLCKPQRRTRRQGRRAYPCPRCGAKAGQPCLGRVGLPIKSLHPERRPGAEPATQVAPAEEVPQFVDPLADGRLTALLRYCARDVLMMACAWQDARLGAEHIDDLVYETHTRIDRRGVAVDVDLARRILAVAELDAEDACRAAEAVGCPRKTLRHSDGLRAWLAERGLHLPNVQAATVMAALEELQRG